MGRWMEIVEGGPVDLENPYSYGREKVLGEIAPHPLMSAAQAVPHEHRGEFPLLVHVCLWIESHYNYESLWIEPGRVGQLLEEYRRLWRICERQEFLRGVDGPTVLKHWQGGSLASDFNLHLASVEELLALAQARGAWVHLMM